MPVPAKPRPRRNATSPSPALQAYLSTEAMRAQSRVLIFGDALSEFMRKLGTYSTSGGTQTRPRNQYKE